jgi:hypothetical protein
VTKTTNSPIKKIIAHTKWSNGKKKGWKPLSSKKKKNSIKDSEGNEEYRYPVSDPNKTMINDTKEPSGAHKKHPQRRNLTRIH